MSEKLLRKLIKELAEAELEEKAKVSKGSEEDDESPGRPRKDPDNPVADYIDNHGGTEKVARKWRLSVPHVNGLANGSRTPSLKKAAKIDQLTGGVIPVKYWL